MPKTAIASREWTDRDALRFLASIANGEIDAPAMRRSIRPFVGAAGGSQEFPLSPLFGFELNKLTEDDLLTARDVVHKVLRHLGPNAAGGGWTRVDRLLFFAGGSAGFLVAGPVCAVLHHQAIRLLNRNRTVLAQCTARAPHSKEAGGNRCARWFIPSRRGSAARFCSPTCRSRAWNAQLCGYCGGKLPANDRCPSCLHTRRRWR